jgi:hypothetical protein
MKYDPRRAQERYKEESKKMVREATIICWTIIVLTVIIIVVGVRLG